ncbi:hypothetical protein [Nocardia sp. NPDC051750]|uniref:hypothetical protein n=1 Tax=Nocardia sp. NPDC051750 TaxID=3364325 RepID=UPI0037A7632E
MDDLSVLIRIAARLRVPAPAGAVAWLRRDIAATIAAVRAAPIEEVPRVRI